MNDIDLDCVEIKTEVIWGNAMGLDDRKEKANSEKIARYKTQGCGTSNLGTIAYEKMQYSMLCAYCKEETSWFVVFPGHVWGVCPSCVSSLCNEPFVGPTGVKGLTWVSKL